MASRYKFSEKEIEGIEQARKENKDKRAECRLKALEMRAKGAISKEVSVATGFHAAYAQHYNIVYTDALPVFQNIHVFLESIYSRFNIDRPEDFKGHSLSVSDIVAIRQAGVVSCYYCDSIGFQKLDIVLEPQNYLKAAEMSMEDDYSMVDGIINNGKAPQLEDTPSMLGQLKEKAEACKDTPSPKKPKSKER